MFDIPPENYIKAVERRENTQLSIMYQTVPQLESLGQKNSWIKSLCNYADKLGINALSYSTKPQGSDKLHNYLLIGADAEPFKELIAGNYKDFPKWEEWNTHQHSSNILMNKKIIDITDIDRRNYFAKNSYICRYMQDIAIVKTAFENEGYPLPDFVMSSTVHSIWELDQMRSNTALDARLRERYDKVYKDAVADYAQYYSKKTKEVLTTLPGRGKHVVKEDYFKDNNITLRWEVVTGDFLDYMKTQLQSGRFPEFIYIKPDMYKKTKNLAEKFEKLGKNGINFWAEDTGETQYHFGFPLSQKHIYATLVNEWQTRQHKSRISIEELKSLETIGNPLELIFVNNGDLHNWNSLCSANNVKWAINDGSYGGCTFDGATSTQIPILYQAKDMEMVGRIVARLTGEIREYLPMSDMSKNEKTMRTLTKIKEAGELIEKRNSGKDI